MLYFNIHKRKWGLHSSGWPRSESNAFLLHQRKNKGHLGVRWWVSYRPTGTDFQTFALEGRKRRGSWWPLKRRCCGIKTFFFLFFPKKSCCRFVSHKHISPGGCACFSSSLRTQESTSEGLNARRKQAQSKRASTCKPRDKSCTHACMQGVVVTQLKCHYGCTRLAKSIFHNYK